jgi:WD40 repeat protein
MYLATGLSNNNIKVWSVESREHLATFVGEAPVTALCFSSDSCKMRKWMQERDRVFVGHCPNNGDVFGWSEIL